VQNKISLPQLKIFMYFHLSEERQVWKSCCHGACREGCNCTFAL